MPFTAKGKCSWFGGPEDTTGVAADEGLAWIYTAEEHPDLFLSYQPPNTSGLARRLNSAAVPYVACRWYPEGDAEAKAAWRPVLLTEMALVTNPKNGKSIKCYPADWGPHEEKTEGRVADLSQRAMEYLFGSLDATDQIVEVVFPFTSRGMPEMPRYSSIALSSGHSVYCQGANGFINEVEEATRVSDLLTQKLIARGVDAKVFHDLTSTGQNQCLEKITNWHNDQDRELDISVHFNSSSGDSNAPIGCEVWYVTQATLADELSAAIASVGLTDRKGKWTDSFWFLNQTMMPSVLLEICFVNSTADCDLYQASGTLDKICEAMADLLGGHLEEKQSLRERIYGRLQHRKRDKSQIDIQVGHLFK